MTLRVQRAHKSIRPGSVDGVLLGPLTVLTGQNGAGKSNLLEALQNGAVVFEELGQLPPDKIRLFRLGELLAVVEGPATASSYKEPWSGLYNNVQNWKAQIPGMAAQGNPGMGSDPAQQEAWLNSHALNSKMISQAALTRMTAATGKPLLEMTVDDFREHAPLIAGVKDPFAASISEVFLSYAQRRMTNEVARWRMETLGRGTALSNEEFVARFGAPPWELLDGALKLVGLSYRFTPPPEDVESVNYEVELVDADGNRIKPGDLSSGERVLLAVAMSLFTGARMSEAIELPRILLLDEADASLHPSMAKSLLTVVEEIFVKQYGVTVILTTHSPSTVALAPEDSLFVMSRTGQKLRKATTDEALSILTVGISALSVRMENRRQVFVESEYDQGVYQDLFRVLKPRISSDRSAEFIAVGKREVGGGCEAVVRLVSELRDAGVTTVFGVVDRDKRADAPANVVFLPDRYSVENLLLDPLILGSFLLRETILPASELGLPGGIRHFDLKAEHGAAIIDALSEKLGYAGDRVECEYVGDFVAVIPRHFLETRGHDLEDHVVKTFPQLKRFKADLKREIVNRAVADKPEFVPKSVITLFSSILDD